MLVCNSNFLIAETWEGLCCYHAKFRGCAGIGFARKHLVATSTLDKKRTFNNYESEAHRVTPLPGYVAWKAEQSLVVILILS